MKQVTTMKGVIIVMLLDVMYYMYYSFNHNIVGKLMIIGFGSNLKEHNTWG